FRGHVAGFRGRRVRHGCGHPRRRRPRHGPLTGTPDDDRKASMGLLEGKRLLITGVITDASLGFHVAKVAQEQGAQVVLTGYGRLRLVERIAQRLPQAAPVVELDVTNQEHLDTLAERVTPHLGEDPKLDGVLHSIGFAPASCLGEGAFLNAPWEDVAQTLHVSAYSFKSLATAVLPLLGPGSSIVGMDFDNRQA